MIFQYIQWAFKADHDIMIFHGVPRYSWIFYDFQYFPVLILHAVLRYSSISHGILVHAASFQDHDIMIFWVIPRCCLIFHDILVYASDLPRQTMASWYSMIFLDIPWYSSILSELPTHIMLYVSQGSQLRRYYGISRRYGDRVKSRSIQKWIRPYIYIYYIYI